MWVITIAVTWQSWPGNGPIMARKLLKAAKRRWGLRALSVAADSQGVLTKVWLGSHATEQEVDTALSEFVRTANKSYGCHASILEKNRALQSTRHDHR